jgi:hypothetical protein
MMMGLLACWFHEDGTIECWGAGRHCWAGSVPNVKREDFNHFIHTTMTEEERKNIHDDTLVKLTDDVNKLIHEAEKKRPDKRIGVLITPLGLFFRYNSNTAPSKEWLEKAKQVTDENVQEVLKLTESR